MAKKDPNILFFSNDFREYLAKTESPVHLAKGVPLDLTDHQVRPVNLESLDPPDHRERSDPQENQVRLLNVLTFTISLPNF